MSADMQQTSLQKGPFSSKQEIWTEPTMSSRKIMPVADKEVARQRLATDELKAPQVQVYLRCK